jgi:hypothetical protein
VLAGTTWEHASGTSIAPEPVPEAIPEAEVLQAISEGGKYDPRLAFLFNQAIVVWDRGLRELRFPDIPDHPTAHACRDYVRRSAIALHEPVGQPPIPDLFAPLIEHARSHDWPEVDALTARATMWSSFRPK